MHAGMGLDDRQGAGALCLRTQLVRGEASCKMPRVFGSESCKPLPTLHLGWPQAARGARTRLLSPARFLPSRPPERMRVRLRA